MTDARLSLRGARRRYGAVQALDGVDLAVAPGERVLLVGRNGAGKSTALRLFAGVLDADAGAVERPAGRVAYLPERSPAPPELSGAVFLRARAALKGVPRAQRVEAVARAAVAAGAQAWLDRDLGALSLGQRQRVVLADALLGAPAFLLLDEPTTGLDPVQVRELRERLAALPGAPGLLLSTHALGELAPIATRVVVLARGQVVADDAPAALAARARTGLLEDALLDLLEAA